MNKRLIFLALLLAICGITFGIMRSRPYTLIHANEGIFSDTRLTLIGVSPKISYKKKEEHRSEAITAYIEGWSKSRKGTLLYKLPGKKEFALLSLELSEPRYDETRALLSFQAQANETVPTDSFLEPTLQID